MDKVGIILLNYNTYQDTIECIYSLQNIHYPCYEIIVVDNCSTDDSYSKLLAISNITLLKSDYNGGFAYGNNIGIEYALKHHCDQILLLNNDTTVEPDFLNELVSVSLNNGVGIVAPKILYYHQKDKIWSAGGTINWNLFVGYNRQNKMPNNHLIEQKQMDFVNGCCMLIKKEVILDIGKLPEDYFMYFEDLDYCVQVGKKYKIMYVSKAVIYHKVSSSSGDSSSFQLEWLTRSQLHFMNKYRQMVGNRYHQIKVEIYLRKYLKVLWYLFRLDSVRAGAILKGMKNKNV